MELPIDSYKKYIDLNFANLEDGDILIKKIFSDDNSSDSHHGMIEGAIVAGQGFFKSAGNMMNNILGPDVCNQLSLGHESSEHAAIVVNAFQKELVEAMGDGVRRNYINWELKDNGKNVERKGELWLVYKTPELLIKNAIWVAKALADKFHYFKNLTEMDQKELLGKANSMDYLSQVRPSYSLFGALRSNINSSDNFGINKLDSPYLTPSVSRDTEEYFQDLMCYLNGEKKDPGGIFTNSMFCSELVMLCLEGGYYAKTLHKSMSPPDLSGNPVIRGKRFFNIDPRAMSPITMEHILNLHKIPLKGRYHLGDLVYEDLSDDIEFFTRARR